MPRVGFFPRAPALSSNCNLDTISGNTNNRRSGLFCTLYTSCIFFHFHNARNFPFVSRRLFASASPKPCVYASFAPVPARTGSSPASTWRSFGPESKPSEPMNWKTLLSKRNVELLLISQVKGPWRGLRAASRLGQVDGWKPSRSAALAARSDFLSEVRRGWGKEEPPVRLSPERGARPRAS